MPGKQRSVAEFRQLASTIRKAAERLDKIADAMSAAGKDSVEVAVDQLFNTLRTNLLHGVKMATLKVQGKLDGEAFDDELKSIEIDRGRIEGVAMAHKPAPNVTRK